MKIAEKFECKNFPRSKLSDLEQELDKIAAPQPGDHSHFTRHIPIESKPYPVERFNFLATHQEGNVSYTITIGLIYTPRMFGTSEEGTLSIDLESRTLGKGELKPSLIPALTEIIKKYNFMDPTIFYTP